MFSSNQTFTINGDDNETLAKVLQCALDIAEYNFIKSFYEDKNGLVFCGYPCDGSTKYPIEATIPVLVEHINQYIKNLSKEDIIRMAGKEPDNDGDVILGWEVFHPQCYGRNELVKHEQAALIAVRPYWIIYGK